MRGHLSCRDNLKYFYCTISIYMYMYMVGLETHEHMHDMVLS